MYTCIYSSEDKGGGKGVNDGDGVVSYNYAELGSA
jgi:hypothetical protein